MACAQTIYFIAQNYILLHCSNFIQNVILKHDRPRPCAALKPIKLHFTSINVILCVHLVPAKLHFARKNVIFWSQELFTSKTEGPTQAWVCWLKALGLGFGFGFGIWGL